MKVRKVENPATPRVTEADIPDMVKALLDAYRRATPVQLENGHGWYDNTRALAEDIAGDVRTGAGLLAAYSPATGWKLTVRYARAMADTRKPQPTLGMSNRRALRIGDGEDFEDVLGGLKTLNFARAIAGDSDAVVVDRWAIRAALPGTTWERVTDRQYVHFAAAYREAASIAGTTPVQMQAVTWLVTRGETGWDIA